MSGSMRLEQITGPRRAMIFTARSLPYRPLTLTRTQRVATTWLPGSPKAIQQVIGPTFEPTTIDGTWKDKFLALDDHAVQLVNFPTVASASAGTANSGTFTGTSAFPGVQRARRATVVSDAIELLVAEGQDIRWQWDQFVRYGKLMRYQAEWGNPTGGTSDMRWELEIEWSGDIEFPPVISTKTVNLLTTAQGLAKILAKILAAIDQVDALKKPNAWANTIVPPLDSLATTVEAIIGSLRTIVSVSEVPTDLAGVVNGLLQQVKREAAALAADLDLPQSATSEAAKLLQTDAVQIAAMIVQLLRRELVTLAAYAAEQQRLLAVFGGDEILATFFADSATSLRDISTRYYGRPDEWARIATYNAFYSSVVPPGTTIRVPALA